MVVDTRVVYLVVILAVATERLFELSLSRRHERCLRQRGALEVGAALYPWMVSVHVGLLVAAPLEVWLVPRPFLPLLGSTMGAVVIGTMALRYWVIATLGERWTTRVLVLPDKPPIISGPFRYLRHPNYLAVAFEVPALALMHGAWVTAVGFGVANLLVLGWRLASEDPALYGGDRKGH